MACKMVSMDLSLQSTGYAVYEDGKLVKYGNFVHKKAKENHLETMSNDIISLLNSENPQIVVVEDVPYTKNMITFKKLERLIARVEAWCQIRDNITYQEYLPKHWRKLLNGPGNGQREEAKAWAMEKTGIMQDDIAEAVLIGQAYITEWT